MPSLLRQSLVCFYCGWNSGKKWNKTVANWQCTKCDAVNYLDENGGITDPPASKANSPAPYVYASHRTTPATPADNDGLFCSTCLKNQHLLTETLASYLPPPDDPNYKLYETSYPTYRKQLEERYPQVCAECEPRVRQRIKAAGYVAKTDHLRRMMDRSRSQDMRSRLQCGWRGVIVQLAALGWWGSIMGQFVWHLAGTMSKQTSYRLIPDTERGSLPGCLSYAFRYHSVGESCMAEVNYLAKNALVLGMATVWWNNKLMEKLRTSGYRMKGLNEFYKLQFVALALRALALWVLRDASLFGLNHATLHAGHAFMLLFIFLSTAVSLRIVQIDRSPRVSFSEPGEKSGPAPQAHQLRKKQVAHSTLPPEPFPISQLAPIAGEKLGGEDVSIPPTPQLEDDLDVMDWTPSQEPFNPVLHNSLPIAGPPPNVPSFSTYQRLPPAPRSWAAQLRNPTVAAPASRIPEQHMQRPFDRSKDPASGGPNIRTQDAEKPAGTGVAPQRFFPRRDWSETGLESLFDAAFSIRDDSAEIAEPGIKQNQCGPGDPVGHLSFGFLTRLIVPSLLAAAVAAWNQASLRYSMTYQLRLAALGIAGAVIMHSLVGELKRARETASSFRVVRLFELMGVSFLAVTVHQPRTSTWFLDVLGTALLSSMIAQRLWVLVFSPRHTTPFVDNDYQNYTNSVHQGNPRHNKAAPTTYATDYAIGSYHPEIHSVPPSPALSTTSIATDTTSASSISTATARPFSQLSLGTPRAGQYEHDYNRPYERASDSGNYRQQQRGLAESFGSLGF